MPLSLSLSLFPFLGANFFIEILFLWLTCYAQGSLQDEASIVEAVKLVDVVICAVSAKQTLEQKLLIRVIKQTGSIKVICKILALKICFWIKMHGPLYL